MTSPLASLLGKRLVQGLLPYLMEGREEHLTIEDNNGLRLIGSTEKPGKSRYAIMRVEETIGWVRGEFGDHIIAEILSDLAEEDLQLKGLAREALVRFKEVNVFYSFSERLAQAGLEKDSVCTVIAYQLKKVHKNSLAGVWLLNEEGDVFEKVYSKDSDIEDYLELKPKQGIIGSILKEKKPELVSNVLQDDRMQTGEETMGSLIAAPLVAGEKVLGLALVYHPDPEVFSANEFKTISAIVTQGNMALRQSFLHQQTLEQNRLRAHMERYVGPRVVDKILKSPEETVLKPIKRPITLLFCDIRGFTQICEEMEPELMLLYLNEYYCNMIQIIFKHNGTLDKIIGDALLAFFNAPEKLEGHQKCAVEAAIEMQREVARATNPWIKEHFKVGIGINCGDCIVGNVGSPEQSDYTAIGDNVNIAARLESLAGPGKILVSDSVYLATKDELKYQSIGSHILSGKQDAVEVFDVQY